MKPATDYLTPYECLLEHGSLNQVAALYAGRAQLDAIDARDVVAVSPSAITAISLDAITVYAFRQRHLSDDMTAMVEGQPLELASTSRSGAAEILYDLHAQINDVPCRDCFSPLVVGEVSQCEECAEFDRQMMGGAA